MRYYPIPRGQLTRIAVSQKIQRQPFTCARYPPTTGIVRNSQQKTGTICIAESSGLCIPITGPYRSPLSVIVHEYNNIFLKIANVSPGKWGRAAYKQRSHCLHTQRYSSFLGWLKIDDCASHTSQRQPVENAHE